MKPDAVFETLRRALDDGGPLVIEGLGTFRRTAEGYEFSADRQPRVFVAYVTEDLRLARRLCRSLRTRGLAPWIDKENLLPGQNWPRAIERAIETSDAFIACFSPRSIVKRVQFQSELRWALDCARRMPLDQAFVIPVRLERCEMPKRIAEETQYVDLFPNWERGMKRIARTIRRSARARGEVEFSSV